MLLNINDIYPTIQGEGKLAGTPMFLVRTAGCDVGCDFCDTKESWFTRTVFQTKSIPELLEQRKKNKLYWTSVETEQIVQHIISSEYCNTDYSKSINWILLTGGEPALQCEPLTELVLLLQNRGFKIAIETSGARYIPPLLLSKLDWICVSPKIMGGKYSNFDHIFLPYAHEFKFVITNVTLGEDFSTVHCFLHQYGALFRETAIISIQPVSNDPEIMEKCVEFCLNTGYNLSVQTHKFIGLK